MAASRPIPALPPAKATPSPSANGTRKRKEQEQLREQAALLDQTRDAILVQDLEGRVRYWNKGAERLYGWSAAEAVGQPVERLFQTGPSEGAGPPPRCAEGEWVEEVQQVTRAGKALVVESRGTLMRDEQGRPRAKLVINSDVTDKKKLEAQFLRAQRLESLGTLAGAIAHDLNNLLTPILMCAPMLRLPLPEAERQALINGIQDNALRGAEVVKQVLCFARGGVEGQRALLNPVEILDEVARMLGRTLPKSITLRVERTADSWPVLGDRTQLFQTLMNLGVNARDAMPGDGGVLTLALENRVPDQAFVRQHMEARPGPYVVLRVKDNGTGIAPEVLDKIFDPFFTTKEPGKGTGLGLATVLGIVRRHQGFVDVQTELGRGTCFSVYLPAAPAGLTGEGAPPPDLPPGRGERILVVDDEASVRDGLQLTLQTWGYKVLTANDGARALALYHGCRGELALVLLDMMMPVLDGPTTLRALRCLDPKLPVIGMSGLPTGARPEDLDGVPVNDHLAKPFTAERLLRAVRHVLDAAAKPKAGGAR